MVKIHQYTMLCAPGPSPAAAIEALKTDDRVVDDMVTAYNHRRRLLVKGLNDMGLRCFEPRGAFYAFPSIKATGLSSDEFAESLLKEERVAVVPGTAFGCGRRGLRAVLLRGVDGRDRGGAGAHAAVRPPAGVGGTLPQSLP